MKCRQLALAAFGVITVTGAANADIVLDELGSFYIGGHEVVLEGLSEKEVSFTPGMAPIKVDPNGEFETGQMYVQYFKLADPVSDLPILMWHGGGLTGNTWETKPDGGPGWNSFFLNAGFDTYVSDAVERGRASWSRYPEIYKSEPLFRTKEEAWELFRIGPTGGWSPNEAERTANKGQQFPAEAFDQFAKSFVPRWVDNNEATAAAYDALVKRVCPCIIMVHSQGGNFGYNVALNNPDLVKALILIEPSGAPDPSAADASKVASIPHLAVFGDYIDQDANWKSSCPPVKAGEKRSSSRAASSTGWICRKRA